MDFSFLDIGFWDILDILIVAYLLYLLYRLVKGSLAFSIFIGMALLYGAWWLVQMLEMDLLSSILGQFFNIGLIILIIIFQPEVRRFLLVLGDSTVGQQTSIFNKLFPHRKESGELSRIGYIIAEVVKDLSEHKTGALIILAKPMQLDYFSKSGVELQAKVSQELIYGIFQKSNPLHDGAVVICRDRVERASVILPVSDDSEVPKNFGLRHRASLGACEQSGIIAIVVSEETGMVSWIQKGTIRVIKAEDLISLLPLWSQ